MAKIIQLKPTPSTAPKPAPAPIPSADQRRQELNQLLFDIARANFPNA